MTAVIEIFHLIDKDGNLSDGLRGKYDPLKDFGRETMNHPFNNKIYDDLPSKRLGTSSEFPKTSYKDRGYFFTGILIDLGDFPKNVKDIHTRMKIFFDKKKLKDLKETLNGGKPERCGEGCTWFKEECFFASPMGNGYRKICTKLGRVIEIKSGEMFPEGCPL